MAAMAAILRRIKKAMRTREPGPAGRRNSLPAFVESYFATFSDKAPENANWIHEINFRRLSAVSRRATSCAK